MKKIFLPVTVCLLALANVSGQSLQSVNTENLLNSAQVAEIQVAAMEVAELQTNIAVTGAKASAMKKILVLDTAISTEALNEKMRAIRQARLPESPAPALRNGVQPASNVLFFEGFEGTAGFALPSGWLAYPEATSANQLGAWVTGTTNPRTGTRQAGVNMAFNSQDPFSALLASPNMVLEAGRTYEIEMWFRPEVVANATTSTGGFSMWISEDVEGSIAEELLVVPGTTINTMWNNWHRLVATFTPATTSQFFLIFHAGIAANAPGPIFRVDDVRTVQLSPNALEIVRQVLPFTQIPASQLITPSAQVRNADTATQTNVVLSASLNGNAVGTSVPVVLDPGVTSAVLSTPSVNPALGNNSLVLSASSAQGATDNVTLNFTGTEYRFAVDNSSPAINISGVENFHIGNIFTVTSPTEISAVEVFFGLVDASRPAADFRVGMWPVVGDVPDFNSPVFATVTANKPENFSGFMRLPVLSGTLPPGRYFLAVIQGTNAIHIPTSNVTANDNREGFGFINNQFDILRSWFTNQPLTIGTPVIRMLVDLPSKSPADGAENVALDAAVTVTFDRNITVGDLSGITIYPTVAGVSASVSDAVLTIAHDGFAEKTEYTVTVPAGAINGFNEVISWTFTTEPGTGLPSNILSDIQIYPNPVNDRMHIRTCQTVTKIIVFDLQGRVVMQQDGNSRTIDMQTVTPGVYAVQIHTETGVVSIRIVRQ